MSRALAFLSLGTGIVSFSRLPICIHLAVLVTPVRDKQPDQVATPELIAVDFRGTHPGSG
jgi:hypothetical protein